MSDYRIKGETGEWEVVIGLEVHAQVTSNAKLFSGAATAFGAEPNTQVSLVDAAMPGMLPVPNRECIRQAVRTGMAIEAQINKWSRFDRKNYFYADLPQGYQISQLYHPLVGEGSLTIGADEKAGIPADKVIGIERIHVEQDRRDVLVTARIGDDAIEAVIADHTAPWLDAAELVDERSIDRNARHAAPDIVHVASRRRHIVAAPIACPEA